MLEVGLASYSGGIVAKLLVPYNEIKVIRQDLSENHLAMSSRAI